MPRAPATLAAEYKHVAVEVPLGSPQFKYFAAVTNGAFGAGCCGAWSRMETGIGSARLHLCLPQINLAHQVVGLFQRRLGQR
jgi:hypothetical protein